MATEQSHPHGALESVFRQWLLFRSCPVMARRSAYNVSTHMLRDATDHLNASSQATANVAERYADEEQVFATAATILESSDDSPIGWSLERCLQRRGNIVITSNRVVIASSFISLLTAVWVFVLGYGIYASVRNPGVVNAMLPILAAAFLFQRRPYFRDIPLSELRRVKFGSVRGMATRHDIIMLALTDRVVHLVPSQFVPDTVREHLLVFDAAGRAAEASSGTIR